MVNVTSCVFYHNKKYPSDNWKKIDCGDNYTTLNIQLYLKCEYTNCTFLNGYVI